MTRQSTLPAREERAGTLRVILGDQLSRGIASLAGLDPISDVVLMAEVTEEATYVRHHKKKIALIFSAMRHFAERLRGEGIRVDYVRLDDPGNAGSLDGEVLRAAARHRPAQIVVAECGEWRLAQQIARWSEAVGIPVLIRDDDRFFCLRAEFLRWAEGRRVYRMENFYREMRKAHAILMTPDGDPEGGQWNYDSENRKRLPSSVAVPPLGGVEPDQITLEVLALVRERFAGHFGDLDPFRLAVTPEDAEALFEEFLEQRLARFGDYQDAMKTGEPFLFHAHVSMYMNCGLLDPRAVVARVERAWRDGAVPLNAAEGFIRQILGWREYVRGLYWLKMPAYARTNHLGAARPIPDFYWSGETEQNCLHQAIAETRANAYAHHIQRLMVTGNFALLIGVRPEDINEWYLVVYADAYEWVELPNTHGMIMYADGGMLGSKPYAASGAYINRMSDYCRDCRYDVAKRSGPDACPFNYLYWHFLIENRGKLGLNQRLAMPYKTLDRMTPERVAEIRDDSRRFLDALVPWRRE